MQSKSHIRKMICSFVEIVEINEFMLTELHHAYSSVWFWRNFYSSFSLLYFTFYSSALWQINAFVSL